MTQDDRMETITDPAAIRASDEPDPFRRNPVAQTGPDDPWRFTRFVADDHECVIVRDEYDEPAPFGSCSTHRRALSSPVALGCTTPAPVSGAGLDLDAVEAEFLRQCGGCDAGLMVGCTCSQRDFRPTMLALVAEVRRLTEESEARRVREMDAVDLAMSERARALSAEAEVEAWPLTLEQVHTIVDYLLGDGSRDGLIHGDTLNRAMGASARRRAALATTGEGQ